MQKVLIIGSIEPDESSRGDAYVAPGRFARLAATLESCGFQVRYSPPSPATTLYKLVADFNPDLAYAATNATIGENPTRCGIHALLERIGLPFVGSSAAVLDMVLDKAALKRRWVEEDIDTPAWELFKAGESPLVPGSSAASRLDELGDFPYIVKPSSEGNSRGIDECSVVRDRTALAARILYLHESFGDALVERFLGDDPGLREFTVATVGNGESALIMPVELGFKQPKAVRLITNDDKEGHRTVVTALPAGELRDGIISFARKAFLAAGIRDYARGDFLMDAGGFHAIEINGQAMIPDRWFEACARDAGLDERGYVAAIFLAAMERHRSAGLLSLAPPAALAALVPEPVRTRLSAAPPAHGEET